MIYDLIIIGSGPGGYEAALSARGKNVLLFEANKIGGVCLNCGCVPTKTLLKSAHVFAQSQHSEIFGVRNNETTLDWQLLLKRRDEVIAQLSAGVSALLKKNKVEVIKARAQIVGAGKVIADGKTYEAENILIATGSRPATPPIIGIDSEYVVDSTKILCLTEPPKNLCVIGGGALGLEFASLFNTLGSKVTVLEMMPQIGGALDSEIAKRLQQNLQRAGLAINVQVNIQKIDGPTIFYTDKNNEAQTITADKILCAAGRAPNIENLGLEAAGINFDKRGIKTDDYGKTNVEKIWACGDVTGKILLAHVATYEGVTAVANMFGEPRRLRYDAIPSVIYTYPEVASVGASEEQLKNNNIAYRKATSPMGVAGRFMIEYPNESGTIKILIGAEKNEILGVHLLGGNAGELIHSAGLMVAKKMTVDDLREIIFPHPTISEAIKIAIMG